MKRAKAAGFKTPFVAVTGDSAALLNPSYFRRKGFAGVVAKPFNSEALETTLKEVIPGWRTPPGSRAASVMSEAETVRPVVRVGGHYGAAGGAGGGATGS